MSAANTELITHILELLEGHCAASARRMFGGHGLFRDGLIFGIVLDETLYLKTDADNLGDFAERGLKPFTYRRQKKFTSLSYYQAPAECLEEAETMIIWADKSYAAALRAVRKKNQWGQTRLIYSLTSSYRRK